MTTIKVSVDWCERNFGAVSDAIPGCVATAATAQGIQKEYISAVEFHREGLDPDEMPDCLKGEYTFDFEYSTSALLHMTEALVGRSALSRTTGISPKLIGHYMTGYRKPRPARRTQIIEGLHQLGNELLAVH